MSWTTALSVLVTYPLVYFFPFNLVRFQWGFKHGLAPMPTEMEDQAEAADRVALFVSQLLLLVIVVLVMRGSRISPYEIGITVENWKSALATGALLGLVSLCLIKLVTAPSEMLRKEAESHGPATTWFGLILLGSTSNEVWRAFCVVALIRLDLPAWLAVAIAALFFATSECLHFSVARAFGRATVGGIAGFLFVYTGSLLAPFAMSLIVGLTNLIQIRRGSTVFGRTSVQPGALEPTSRFDRPCPACGEVIQFLRAHRAQDMIACPNCNEPLTTNKKHLWVVGVVSVLAAAYVTKDLIHRDSGYLLVTEGVAFILYLIGAFLSSFIVVPQYKRLQRSAFNRTLSLFKTGESDADKKKK